MRRGAANASVATLVWRGRRLTWIPDFERALTRPPLRPAADRHAAADHEAASGLAGVYDVCINWQVWQQRCSTVFAPVSNPALLRNYPGYLWPSATA
ncbi:hypothetical protein MRX96_004487 [Rhipicephalus microplus]